MKQPVNRTAICLMFFAVFSVSVFFTSCGSQSSVFRDVERLRTKNFEDLSPAEQLELELANSFTDTDRYISYGRFEEALAILWNIVSNHSNTPYADKAFYVRGTIYSHMLYFHRDIEKAAAAYRMVLASEPVTEFDVKAQNALELMKNQ